MARTTLPQEVDVLRFFETGSIDKVEAVFNIVCEKMRERLNRGTSFQQSTGTRRRKGQPPPADSHEVQGAPKVPESRG